MPWHTVIMAEREFIEFMKDLNREYRREIAAGLVTGYTLFARRRDAGDHQLFIPPAAMALFERMPSWKRRLRPYRGTPELKRFTPVPMLSAQ
jgi:hypothetical protein